NTARAADADQDGNILVVLEMGGGNDGLNTVVPYANDLYHKARPTLHLTKKDVIPVNDQIGLHNALSGLQTLHNEGSLAVVQGVGYPNPDRSHFESMDIWQSADPKRATPTGWLGRAAGGMDNRSGGIPGMFLGDNRLPVAMQGADGGVISLADRNSFKLQLSGNASPRKKLLEDLNGDD